MRVEFLGTGGYYPNERRHTMCVFLPEVGVVFDAGTGFFRVPPRLQTPELHIFLSHSHLDHVVGLTILLVAMATGTVKEASVYGTDRSLAAIRDHLFAEPVFPLIPPCKFQPLATSVEIPGGGVVTHHALNHPGGSTGFRVDWPDRSLAYITDTIVDGTYTDFIRGVDLLIHECYFSDELADWASKTGHSHTTPVAELAREAGVRRLVLVHIDPRRDDADPIGLQTARAVFPATELAQDLMTFDF